MQSDGSMRYSLQAPFNRAVGSVCNVLRSRGLHIAGQLDLAERLERALGILMPPCRIVFVLPNPEALTTDAIHPWAAVFLPLHVVISGDDQGSEIRIQSAVQPARDGRLAMIYRPVRESHAQVVSAIETIATRTSFLA
jgi:uncharacterized protein (DUF302 family)